MICLLFSHIFFLTKVPFIYSMSKTRELQVSDRLHIYKKRMEGKSLQQIAHEFGISKEDVRKICQKLNRRQVNLKIR